MISALGLSVLVALADADGPLEEGELKRALGRSWSLEPTLRALRRRSLVERVGWWQWSVTDAGLEAIGRPPSRPALRLILGGAA